jgi:hypothetical protein
MDAVVGVKVKAVWRPSNQQPFWPKNLLPHLKLGDDNPSSVGMMDDQRGSTFLYLPGQGV